MEPDEGTEESVSALPEGFASDGPNQSALDLREKLAQLHIRPWAEECLDLEVAKAREDDSSKFRVISSYQHYSSFGHYETNLTPLPRINEIVYLYTGSVDVLPKGALIVPTLANSHAGQILAERDTCSLEVDGQYYVLVHVPRGEDAPSLRSAYDTALSAAHFSGQRVIILPLLAGTPFPLSGTVFPSDSKLNSIATTAAPALGYTPIVPAIHIMAERLRAFVETMPPDDIDAIFVCINNERALAEMRRVLPTYLPTDREAVAQRLEQCIADEQAEKVRRDALYRRSQPKPPAKPKPAPKKR